jgi:hypothetical protein
VPAYIQTPINNPPRTSLLPGDVGYSLGSFSTYGPHDPGCTAQVTTVAITSNVATVGLKILAGYKPLVNQLISITGTVTGAGEFNVTNVAIASVSGFNTGDNSTGTVTFALTGANVSTTNDAGEAYMPPLETADLAGSAIKGLQLALGADHATVGNKRVVSWSYEFPSAPSSATIALEVATVDQDAAYTALDTQSSPVFTGETRVLSVPASTNFVRIHVTSVSGGSSPSVVGRVSC